MTKNQIDYLARLGLLKKRDRQSPDHLAKALIALRESGAGFVRSHNRYTRKAETPVAVIAKALGVSNNYVSQEICVWLERFLGAYDPNDPLFTEICPPKIAKIITPSQLIYLISLDFPEF